LRSKAFQNFFRLNYHTRSEFLAKLVGRHLNREIYSR
jgi:hypothetical protein